MNTVALAGWVGLFVTALNLLPISQLDGGHISYAVFGRKSRLIAVATFVTLATVTVLQGFHYSLILVLLWFMGIGHPPTLNDDVDLGRPRRIVGALLLVVFILCFTPVPIEM
jgi:membrane-associated protease RseP (regulator of RpoE activity)